MSYIPAYTKWQEIYYRYRDLYERWNCLACFEEIIKGNKDVDLYIKVPQANEFNKETWQQLLEAVELRGYIKTIPNGWSPDQPFEDVYQAALWMETVNLWHGDQGGYRIYRGQRNHNWSVIPSLFRGDRFLKAKSKKQIKIYLENEIEKICGYVRILQKNHAGISEEEGIAIVQHYSSELNLGTWLIDFTYDPLVSLFFASYGGCDGDIGKISYITSHEWEFFSAGGTNRLGKVRILEPKNVPRIEAQKALFLDTSHPDLWEQFNPFSLYFKQHTGLLFKDESRRPKIISQVIYPENDYYRNELLESSPDQKNQPLKYLPASDVSKSLTADDYLQLVISWYKNKGRDITENECKVLRQVCDIHAQMQKKENREKVIITSRSLNRLEKLADIIIEFGITNLEEIYEWLLNESMTPKSKETIKNLILGKSPS